jgi:hypothetical protein
MTKRFGLLLLAGVVSGGAAWMGAAARVFAQQVPLTVHEWGTFTSVAGLDGQSIDWRPLDGPSDLPCFVTKLNPNSIKSIVLTGEYAGGIPAKVRMETPVLYFYTPVDTSVRVHVRFPKGLITEWYPRAAVPPVTIPLNLDQASGSIDWNEVRVTPNAPESFPREAATSHYYAARDTDAAPVRVGRETEKFLFYRGIGSFAVPIRARGQIDGTVSVDAEAGSGIGEVIVFANDGRRLGYQITTAVGGHTAVERSARDTSLPALKQELAGRLVSHGLYPREAEAMIATWGDSWFEEGTRVFYVLPQSSVDAILPLDIAPVPAQVARVFVGRVEVIMPEMQESVARAIDRNDLDALSRYGRWLEPIAKSLLSRESTVADRTRIQDVLRSVAAGPTARSCQ